MKGRSRLRVKDFGVVAGALLLAALSRPAEGASATWSGSAGTVWADVNNWVGPPASAPGTGDTATFDGAGAAQPLIDTSGGIAIRSIVFDTASAPAYTIGAQGALQVDPGGDITLTAAVAQNQSVNAAINVSSTGATLSNAGTASALVVNGAITFAVHNMTLSKTGAGELRLTGVNWLNPNSPGSFGRLTVTGGGKIVVSGQTYVTQSSGNKTGTSYDGNVYVGKDAAGNGSGNNFLEVSGTGFLWSDGLNLGGYGGAVYPNSYGNNRVLLSAPGTAAAPTFRDWQQGGEGPSTTCLGNNTDSNVVRVINGACFNFGNNGSGMGIGTSVQAAGGACYNGMILDGYGGGNPSRFESGGSRYVQVGGGPKTVAGAGIYHNYMIATNGGYIHAARMNVGQQGTNNYVCADGASGGFVSYIQLDRFCVGGNAGTGNASGSGNHNYVKITRGAQFKSTGGSNLPNCIGATGTSSHNYIRCDGRGSMLYVQNNNAPFTIGGDFRGGANNDAPAATSNCLAVTDGAAAYVNSVYLQGAASRVRLGNGTTNTATMQVRADTTTTYTQGVYLAKSDARLEINNGRLMAGQNGAVTPGPMVCGPGKVQLNGPAYFATDYSGSAVRSEVGGGGSLIKEGAGTLTLTATNTYSGATIVSNGVLRLTHPACLSAETEVWIRSGAVVDLAFRGINIIRALYIDGAPLSPGTYGPGNLPGKLTGTGYLRTVSGSTAKGLSLIVR